MSRQTYRHQHEGQRGFLVEHNGQQMIQLDRDSEKILKPFTRDWLPEVEQKPLTSFQVAQVCWAADVQVCKFLGVQLKKKEWIGLLDEEKIEFSKNGPDKPALRAVVYERVKSALAEFTK